MRDLGIKRGEWFACCLEKRPHYVFAGAGEAVICTMGINDPDHKEHGYEMLMDDVSLSECQNHARLIQDAGNTAQKCGLFPGELLKQRDELKDALQNLMDGVRGLPPLTAIVGVLEQQYIQAEIAIKNTNELKEE